MKTLKLARLPGIPMFEEYKLLLEKRWKEICPDVALSYVAWDGGWTCDNTDDFDIFVFDAQNVNYFKAKGALNPINKSELIEPDNYHKYMLDCIDDHSSTLPCVPMFSCGYFLFYYKDDKEVDEANTLKDLLAIFENQKGGVLLADLPVRWLTVIEYLQMLNQEKKGKLDTEIDMATYERFKRYFLSLRLCATKVWDIGTAACIFVKGEGRAYVGFSDTMLEIPPSMREKITFKLLPRSYSAPDVNPYMFADYVGINPLVIKKGLYAQAVKLVNLISSNEFMLEYLAGSIHHEPLLVIPARKTTLRTLASTSEIYARHEKIINSYNPTAFALGGDAKKFALEIEEKMYKDPDLVKILPCLLYKSPSPRDATLSRMPSSA
eukprot:TRINITY_DN3300_c0_g1_i1.p1 TRINITY_DN3300_c0_g1~~TRINITY_DN3300_c0_g1_i1.p1  ORF type:complete len:379 (-),score=74.16 TRINITY_DN3300_c0_g1_i1:10-1146(-)